MRKFCYCLNQFFVVYLEGRSVVYFVDAVVACAAAEDGCEDLQADAEQVGPRGGSDAGVIQAFALVRASLARVENHLHDHS